MNGSTGSVTDDPLDGLTFREKKKERILYLISSVAPPMMFMNHESMYDSPKGGLSRISHGLKTHYQSIN